jgi:hypothetical protein
MNCATKLPRTDQRRRLVYLVCAFPLMLAASACNESLATSALPTLKPAQQSVVGTVSRRVREERGEQILAELEEDVPGAGGFYFDRAGQMNV